MVAAELGGLERSWMRGGAGEQDKKLGELILNFFVFVYCIYLV